MQPTARSSILILPHSDLRHEACSGTSDGRKEILSRFHSMIVSAIICQWCPRNKEMTENNSVFKYLMSYWQRIPACAKSTHQEIRNYMRVSLPLKKSKWIFQRQSDIWWVIQDQDLRLRRFVQHQTKGKGKRRHNTDGSHFGPRKNKPKGIMAGRNDRPLQNQSIRHSRRDRRQVVMPTRPYSRIPKLYSNGYIRWYFEGWRTWRVIMEGSVWRCNDDGRRFHSLIRSL